MSEEEAKIEDETYVWRKLHSIARELQHWEFERKHGASRIRRIGRSLETFLDYLAAIEGVQVRRD